MKKLHPVVHFEMPAEDRQRMAKFYTEAFGWKTQFFGEDMGNYVTVTTTEVDDKGMPKMPGAINGGFFPKNAESPSQYPSVVISTENIRESINDVTKAGGKVLGEPVDIPGVGKYVSFRDTEGNIASLLQPVMG